MPHGGDDFLHQIRSPQPQAGSIDAGMAAEKFTLQHILVNQQLHMMLVVVH